MVLIMNKSDIKLVIILGIIVLGIFIFINVTKKDGSVAEVYYENDKYYMNLKYYLIDTYEFPYHWTDYDNKDSLSRMAHGLHEAGYAKEYRIIGCLENTFEWSKGEILLEDLYNKNIKVDIDALNKEPLY